MPNRNSTLRRLFRGKRICEHKAAEKQVRAHFTQVAFPESTYGGGFHIQNREIKINTNNTHWEETRRQKYYCFKNSQ